MLACLHAPSALVCLMQVGEKMAWYDGRTRICTGWPTLIFWLNLTSELVQWSCEVDHFFVILSKSSIHWCHNKFCHPVHDRGKRRRGGGIVGRSREEIYHAAFRTATHRNLYHVCLVSPMGCAHAPKNAQRERKLRMNRVPSRWAIIQRAFFTKHFICKHFEVL